MRTYGSASSKGGPDLGEVRASIGFHGDPGSCDPHRRGPGLTGRCTLSPQARLKFAPD